MGRDEGERSPDSPDIDLVDLADDTCRAWIAPGIGGRLAQLDLGGGPLLRGPAAGLGWAAWGSYVLAPWSNRIPAGRYRFGGVEAQLAANWPDGSAIHGLVASCAWRLLERSGQRARLEAEATAGPWSITASQSFVLSAGQLSHEVVVQNRGTRPVPAGLGIHPWFRAGRILVPAAEKWPGDPMPIGAPVPVSADDDLRSGMVPPPMDRCFTSLEGTMVEAPGVRLSWDGPVTQVVVYTGEPGWVALEPVTMANGGFDLADRGMEGHGVVVLDPGEELAVTYRFTSD
jgi:aldose 1-epimerase